MNSKFVNNILKTLLSLLLGLFILWMLYRKTDFDELWVIIKTANLGFLLLSLPFGLAGNIIRGLRWELFVNSLGYKPKRKSIIFATLGNYAVNFLLPRAGDVWRCGVVSKYDKIPFSKTLETFLIDKVIEFVAGVIIFLVSVLLYIDFFISYFHTNPQFADTVTTVFSSPWPYVSVFLIALAILIGLRVFKESSLQKKISNIFEIVKRDLRIISGMKEKKKVIIYTILMWLAFYLYLYITLFAFDFTKDLGLVAGLILFSMANIGVSIPVQGGIGTWHFMVISSLVLFGIAESQASAYAGAVFAIQSIWTILYGVIAIMILPHVKRDTLNNQL